MRKKLFVYSAVWTVLAVVNAIFLSQGCVERLPTLSSAVATSTPTLPPDLVSNFENGSVTVNPNLQNGDKGFWQAGTYGGAGATFISGGVTTVTTGNTIDYPFVVRNTVPDSTDSSGFAAHVFAPLINVGAWESDQLMCYLDGDASNPYYPYYAAPASFTGIQFLINIPADDTNTLRLFQIAIDQTLPVSVSGGTCSPTAFCPCYNHFQVALPGGSTGGWTLVIHPWADFAVYSCPSSVSPADLASHLDKIVFLQFQFGSLAQGSTSSPVSTYTDFWLDEVKFLP